MTTKPSVGFIGGGVMAQAMAKGFIHANVCHAIHVFDQMEAARNACSTLGMRVEQSNKDVINKCSVIVLAVKPQALPMVYKEIGTFTGNRKLLISICAGVTIEKIEKGLKPLRVCTEGVLSFQGVVRVMPNIACTVLQSATAFCTSAEVSPEEKQLVVLLLQTTGIVHEVAESQLDAVTGVSGSGPAYVYTMIEAMSDGGVLKGLSRDVATSLAIQTIIGACTMVKNSGKHPAELRDMVTSPGGTTMAGVAALERNGFRNAVISAVEAAANRSTELGRT
eukprot:GHVS01073661.1.p1 GENE.GHVS01073661.1~~GHVS01073661.1.p1  ORF type:complete len:279 (-),score=26.83 GHVS01073661.1:764-1600(-)